VKELLTDTPISFKAHENDFLQFHLFDDATNTGVKKRRSISYIGVIITAAFLGFITYQKINHISVSTMEIILVVFCICLLPTFNKWSRKNQYRKFVRKTYKGNFGKLYTLNFNRDFIGLSDSAAESKIKLSEVDEVVETNKYFFVKLKTSASIIIPKEELENVDELRKELISVAGKAHVKFLFDSNWC
jgi:hypothetical protein